MIWVARIFITIALATALFLISEEVWLHGQGFLSFEAVVVAVIFIWVMFLGWLWMRRKSRKH
ncbi:MAG TPA: hypothetical protein VI873_01475 [Candidatus Peribacteraceae bacterium]|nr:hypothetical protein [Candidatus Peribacteraceae bacterium]